MRESIQNGREEDIGWRGKKKKKDVNSISGLGGGE